MVRKVGKEWLRNRKKGIFWNVKLFIAANYCIFIVERQNVAIPTYDSCHSFLLLKVSKGKLLANDSKIEKEWQLSL